MGTFQWNHIRFIIIASTIAMIALLALQAKWLFHSKKLIEEQFNQKVSMAMCMTVADLGERPNGCSPSSNVASSTPLLSSAISTTEISVPITEAAVRVALDRNLQLFDLPLDYKVSVQEKETTCLEENSPGCCSMVAVSGFENHLMILDFPNQTKYFLGRMGLMIGSSILILLFITSILWLASHYLIQQKRISEHNKDFFNNMAHEFRTPLTNMKLAVRLFKKKNNKISDNAYLNIVHKETENLTHQVERVLHLSNLQKGAYELRKEAVYISKLLQDLVSEMSIQLQEKQANIQLDIPDNIIIQGDAFHLKNAFRNLIDNTLKYCLLQPNIHITMQAKGKGILLLFEDNGIGISKANQAVIFDNFQRVSTGDVHTQKGFGIGLAYVKKVVELHKGFIKVFSELNKGSQFTLYLPFGK